MLPEGALEQAADLFVLDRYQARHQLDDGHLRPVGAPQVGELDTDGAAAYDDRPKRHVAQIQGLAASDDHLAVHRHGRQLSGPGAGGHDYVGGSQGAAVVDLHGAKAGQPAGASHVLHVVLLEQEADSGGEPLDHLPAAVDRLAEVVGNVFGGDAELLAVSDQVDDLGVPEERLAGNAAPVEADAADLLTLDDGGLHP